MARSLEAMDTEADDAGAGAGMVLMYVGRWLGTCEEVRGYPDSSLCGQWHTFSHSRPTAQSK